MHSHILPLSLFLSLIPLLLTGLWSDPGFASSGSLFWPDYWPPGTEEAQEVVYDAVGLKHEVAAVSLLCPCLTAV